MVDRLTSLRGGLPLRRRNAAARTRPIGIDIGEGRVRVARVDDVDGRPNVVAVSSRERAADPLDAIRDAIAELGTVPARCVVGLTEPSGLVRTGFFPPSMGATEREKAARFEAARYIDYPVSEATLRLYRTPGAEDWIVAVARKSAIDMLAALAKRLRCRIVAVDHVAFALRRAFPDADCVVDVGESATTCYVFGARIPIVQRIDIGGRAFTEAIRDSLGIDLDAAERRKRTTGLAGAGEYARDLLVDAIASAFVEVRASGAADVTSALLVGNGARLDGLAAAIERVTAVPIRLAALAPALSSTIPADVLRAATPDWGIAIGLALWAPA